jgi:hypothetical protein
VLDTITAPTPPPAATSAATARAMRALHVANTRRTAVAELKARLRRRELTLTDLVLDSPAELHGYLLFDVLQWAPRYGRPKLRALNARAIRLGQLNLACELGALTARQRRWLATQLGGR